MVFSLWKPLRILLQISQKPSKILLKKDTIMKRLLYLLFKFDIFKLLFSGYTLKSLEQATTIILQLYIFCQRDCLRQSPRPPDGNIH